MGGRSSFCIVALLVASLLAGCTSERDFAPIAEAGWRPGYTYEYSVESKGNSDGQVTVNGETQNGNAGFQGDENFGPSPLFSYTVFNTETTVDGTPVLLALVQGGTMAAQAKAQMPLQSLVTGNPDVVAFRKSDLAPLYTSTTSYPGDVRIDVHDTHQPSSMRFPLTGGETWRMELSGLTVESSVGGLVSVKGPSGDVDAVHIQHVSSLPDGYYDKAMQEAQAQGITVHSLDFSISSEREVYFAPSLHNVVLDIMTLSERVAADFEQDGNHTVIDMTVEATITIRLTGVSLEEGPQRSLADALGGKVTIPIVPDQVPVTTGTGGPGGPVGLKLEATPSVVNAAQPQEVGFHTTVTGQVSGLSYDIRDEAGAVETRGFGGDFRHTFTKAGAYKATVTGSGPDGKSLHATVDVYADFDQLVPADCPTVAAQGYAGCPATPLQVEPGARSLTVGATRQSNAGEPGFGTLTLVDPDGKTTTAQMAGNTATLTVQDPAPGTWQVEFDPTLGVTEGIDYTLHVQHSP